MWFNDHEDTVETMEEREQMCISNKFPAPTTATIAAPAAPAAAAPTSVATTTVAPTSTTTTTEWLPDGEGAFVFGKDGQKCNGEGRPITTVKGCEGATEVMKRTGKKLEFEYKSEAHRPKGCYIWKPRRGFWSVWFNDHEDAVETMEEREQMCISNEFPAPTTATVAALTTTTTAAPAAATAESPPVLDLPTGLQGLTVGAYLDQTSQPNPTSNRNTYLTHPN